MSGRHSAPDRFGPRIVLKRDDASAIGRGAVLLAAHLRQTRLLEALAIVAEEAPELADGTLEVTEGFRPGTGLHPMCLAFDIGVHAVLAGTELERAQIVERWRQRAQRRLGLDFDLLFEGDHLHLEHDPKPLRAVS